MSPSLSPAFSGGAGEAWGGERTDSDHTAVKLGQNSASVECPATAPAFPRALGMWSLLEKRQKAAAGSGFDKSTVILGLCNELELQTL